MTEDATQALLSVLGGDYNLTLTNALFGSGHPDREYTFIVGSNALPPGQLATNFTRITNDDIDEGLDAARVTDDLEEQSAAWGQVQQGLADEMAFIFVTHNELGDVATPDVKDVLDVDAARAASRACPRTRTSCPSTRSGSTSDEPPFSRPATPSSGSRTGGCSRPCRAPTAGRTRRPGRSR